MIPRPQLRCTLLPVTSLLGTYRSRLTDEQCSPRKRLVWLLRVSCSFRKNYMSPLASETQGVVIKTAAHFQIKPGTNGPNGLDCAAIHTLEISRDIVGRAGGLQCPWPWTPCLAVCSFCHLREPMANGSWRHFTVRHEGLAKPAI